MRPPANPILIALGGLCLGLIALLVWHRETAPPSTASLRDRAPAAPNATSANTRTKAEEDKVLLGDVARVPFQELYGVLSRRSADEIGGLARQLQNLPKSPATETRVAAFFKVWATLDASAAFASAVSLRPDLRSAALGTVLGEIDASAAGSLIPAISNLQRDSLPPSERARLLARAVGKWSEIDPAAAAKFLDSNGERGLDFSMAYNAVASNWAASDPVAALAWARESAGNGQHFATSGAITGWWKDDRAAAEAYVASHLATRDDWQLASSLASNIFDEDPERAKEWVSRLPNDDARKQAAMGLAAQWGFSDPAGASSWVATLSATERELILPATIGLWAQQNAPAAAQWIGSYEGAGRDQAVYGFSLNVAAKDPAAALNWAATISDPKTRASAAQSLAGDWLKHDPQAARIWIESSSLSDVEKAQLLSPSPAP